MCHKYWRRILGMNVSSWFFYATCWCQVWFLPLLVVVAEKDATQRQIPLATACHSHSYSVCLLVWFSDFIPMYLLSFAYVPSRLSPRPSLGRKDVSSIVD